MEQGNLIRQFSLVIPVNLLFHLVVFDLLSWFFRFVELIFLLGLVLFLRLVVFDSLFGLVATCLGRPRSWLADSWRRFADRGAIQFPRTTSWAIRRSSEVRYVCR
jgi:hypothetical protein